MVAAEAQYAGHSVDILPLRHQFGGQHADFFLFSSAEGI
jgi:hypothetical protein